MALHTHTKGTQVVVKMYNKQHQIFNHHRRRRRDMKLTFHEKFMIRLASGCITQWRGEEVCFVLYYYWCISAQTGSRNWNKRYGSRKVHLFSLGFWFESTRALLYYRYLLIFNAFIWEYHDHISFNIILGLMMFKIGIDSNWVIRNINNKNVIYTLHIYVKTNISFLLILLFW